jgi:hypothetical protein
MKRIKNVMPERFNRASRGSANGFPLKDCGNDGEGLSFFKRLNSYGPQNPASLPKFFSTGKSEWWSHPAELQEKLALLSSIIACSRS